MRPTETPPPSNPGALAPVEQALGWLLSAAGHLLIALAVAVLIARLMRRGHLHWSWSLLALAPVLLVRALLGGLTATLALAAIVSAAMGRRWHRQDRDAGRDLARIAGDRRSPLDVLQRLFRSAAAFVRSNGPAELEPEGGELALGRDRANRLVRIPFGEEGRGTHTLVLGATGSGKTMTQAWIASQAIGCGMGAVVIDPKGDRALRAALLSAVRADGRRFIEWTPEGPRVYNPFAHGSDTAIADKTLAGERFTEPHYQRQAQRYLGHVVRALRGAQAQVSLGQIVVHLEPERLEQLARTLPEREAQATHDYLDGLTARQRVDLGGVRDRLAILAESDVGQWLEPREDGRRAFDLLAAVRARAVVYFDLDADSRPLLTQMLGAAIVQDLKATVAALQGRPLPTLVVIDEFAALAAEHVVGLFGRARGAGFSLLLGTQELADLRLPGRERLGDQIMGNLTALVAHRQVVPSSAALVASLAGTTGVWQTSWHSDGRTTRTRSSTGVLDPDEITDLAPGSAAVIVLTRRAETRIAQVFSA
jgi:conjugal transfer pilus assembly protein TraD